MNTEFYRQLTRKKRRVSPRLLTPLPEKDRGNLSENPQASPTSGTTIIGGIGREKLVQRLAEGRKAATPKKAYADAIAAHCLECWGHNPLTLDCEGHLCDCALYPVNTRQKRFKTTKTALKKAIRRECINCLGTTALDQCTSSNCNLFSWR